MIRVVDYGLGNVQAFLTSFQRLGVAAARARSSEDLQGASKVILPGVGAFDHAMALLEASGMVPALRDLATDQQVPILGICVGMQILADRSDEGVLPGLGLIPGSVCAFSSRLDASGLPKPHMGWNDVQPMESCPLFWQLDSPRFYFLHSYFFDCAQPDDAAGITTYGFPFQSAVQRGNIFGVQFHPEKSHHWGVGLLRNFARL
jgi:imidazole glycerol-phosphate synthase subunit HisH